MAGKSDLIDEEIARVWLEEAERRDQAWKAETIPVFLPKRYSESRELVFKPLRG